MSGHSGQRPGDIGRRVLTFAAVFVLLAALAIVREGRLMGHDLRRPDIEKIDGVINTTESGHHIVGYGGTVPVEIFVTAGRIDSVRALPNRETPRFFARLTEGNFMHSWDGRTLEEAATMNVDAVSGATFSSRALVANVRAGASEAIGATEQDSRAAQETPAPDAKTIAALAVLLCAAIVPLFCHGPTFRTVQQVLDVAVLGFWTGTFIDYAMMVNFFANGPRLTLASAMTVLLLAVGIVYPLAGRRSHYCTWVCPYGAAQDLAGHLSKRKLHVGPRTARVLTMVRRGLWGVLMALLLAGAGTAWIDNEIFTAFIVDSASRIVLVAGAAFVLLAIVVPRPFCRWVCPTGTLLRGN